MRYSVRCASRCATTNRSARTSPRRHAFDVLVDEIPRDCLGLRTANGLTIHELVIHLAAMESLLAMTLGSPTEADLEQPDIEARTAELIQRYHDRPVDDARAVWRRSVEAVRRWAAAPENAHAEVACYDLFFTRDNLLLARSFETWTHSDDIRRALHRPARRPEPRALNRMAGMSVTTLPIALEVTGRAHRGKSARIVLTGSGGGTWLVPLGRGEAAAPADIVLTADIVDWCLVVAERLSPDALPHEAQGDRSLVPHLVEAASVFATL